MVVKIKVCIILVGHGKGKGKKNFFKKFQRTVNNNKKTGSHVLKFFTNEIGTSGSVEGNRAIFQGKHSKTQLTKLLERYVNDYLLCPECSKPETHFITQNRVELMKCDACGSRSAIRSLN